MAKIVSSIILIATFFLFVVLLGTAQAKELSPSLQSRHKAEDVKQPAAAKHRIEIIEVSEASIQRSDKWSRDKDKAEDEKLSEECEKTVTAYIEAKKNMDEWLRDLENVVVVNEIVRLKQNMGDEKNTPKECIAEIESAIENMIAQSFDVESDSVDWDKASTAAKDMEKELMPQYKDVSDLADRVCEKCSSRPPKLQNDPIECRLADLERHESEGAITCPIAVKKYEQERDELVYKRDMCREKRKLDRMNMILLWFQGRSDLPLTCAVQIKEFIDELKAEDEREASAAGSSFTIMETMCGQGLFPVYRRFGQVASRTCRVCTDILPALEKDGIDCFK